MSTTTPLTDAINALTTYANETTGASDTDLSSAVASLVAGYGGGSSTDYLAEICNGTITRLDDDNITNIKTSLFRGYSSSSLVVFLRNCVSLDNAYCLGGSGITTVVLPALEYVSSNGFFFSGTSNMTALDIGSSFSTESYGIRSNAINGASALTTLILRKTTGIVPLQSLNAFNGTPFKSGGSGGTIYVPSSLISAYQSATNWATINGYGTITWTAIEGSQYETHYADGTSIS